MKQARKIGSGMGEQQSYWQVSFVCFLLSLFLFAAPLSAQDGMGLNPDRDQPLEILAEETLEWHRNIQQYIARGNAVARQGDVTIKADILTADYRETEASAFEIHRLTASGHVEILSRGNVAKGDKAVYNVDRGVAVMTGQLLSLTSPDQKITARDTFEYRVTDGRLDAVGDTYAVRGTDTLRADKMTALFYQNKVGKRELKQLEAHGDVVITTPTEVLRGKKGVYKTDRNVAELTGAVKIERGPNVLTGERAEVNLTTNVSKMFANPAQGGRVRGTFYPGSEGEQGKKPIRPPEKRAPGLTSPPGAQ